MSYSHRHGIFSLSFSLLLLLLSPPPSAAQFNQNNERYSYARFSPSLTIIIVVLIAALFFVGLFAIYIRNCSDTSGIRSVNGGIGRSMRGRGLEAAVIETFPIMVYSEVKDHKIGKGALECAVCLNEFEDDETLRLIPKCDHVFHPECIDAWLASHTTCPVCRANLVPQPGDTAGQLNESGTTVAELDLEAQNNSRNSEPEEQRRTNNNDVNSLVAVQAAQTDRPRKLSFLRSHSTGHSLVQPVKNTDRFTLRLPDDVRKQLISRKLNRATSLVLPRERSSRRGYRTSDDGGSSRGKLDRGAKSDRWVLSNKPPFFSRASSMKSPKVTSHDGEGTSSLPVGGPVPDSSRPPV